MNYYELSINVIISVLFISLFIGIFFFTYAAQVEGTIVKNQMKFLSEDVGIYINLLGENVNKKVKDKILALPNVNLDEEDNKVKESNSEVMKKAIIANSVFTIVSIIIIYFLNKKVNLNIKDVVIKNLIILIFIGLTEYVFLTYFATDFISINPNLVKYSIVENIKKIF